MSDRILVVDDEADIVALFRQAFRRDLKQGRFTLEFAQSAVEALRKIDGGRIDEGQAYALVLSDINMPGKSGFDLVSECRSVCPDVPVLLISAYGDEATRSNALRCGAVGLLPKPIDFAALRTEIEARVT